MDARSLAVAVRRQRETAGMTQAQLAAHAGMSRQMIGAIEAGRHLPRVDSGVALAQALGVTVESLLGPQRSPVVDVTGAIPPTGPVRLGMVGDRLVCASAPVGAESWTPADGIARDGAVEVLPGARPGAVVAGCDPAIGLAARLVADRGGLRLLAVAASTRAALDALAAGRTHAAVVHGLEGRLPRPCAPVERWHLARWRVGLASHRDAHPGWWREALAGRVDVVQRDAGAGSQEAFVRAVDEAGGRPAAGPLAGGHLEAASLARAHGLVAVTIEPAALAAGLAFHPLETHVAQLWVAAAWVREAGIALLGEALTSAAFHRQLDAVGGYDLTGCGTAAA